MSCGAACARQLLLDEGVDITEIEIRTVSGFTESLGTEARPLAEALSLLDKPNRYSGGAVMPDDLDALLANAPFIALLKIGNEKHWLIVDGVTNDELLLRDPAGTVDYPALGAECTVFRGDFEAAWLRAVHGTVFRIRT